MARTKTVVAWGVILALAFVGFSWGGNCHHFFAGHHHVQKVAVVQPLYFAGQATENEAVMRKAIREELAALMKAQPQQSAPQSQPVAQEGSVLAFKCGKCHSGDGARGGVRFDLAGIPDDHFRRSMEIMGLAKVWDGQAWVAMPTAMKPHVEGLTPADKGAITEEMLYKPATAEAPGVLR